MTEVRLLHLKAGDVIDIVREVREFGLVQGRDFDFTFVPATFNNDGHEAVSPRYAVFKFHVEKWASWFILKYAQQ